MTRVFQDRNAIPIPLYLSDQFLGFIRSFSSSKSTSYLGSDVALVPIVVVFLAREGTDCREACVTICCSSSVSSVEVDSASELVSAGEASSWACWGHFSQSEG